MLADTTRCFISNSWLIGISCLWKCKVGGMNTMHVVRFLRRRVCCSHICQKIFVDEKVGTVPALKAMVFQVVVADQCVKALMLFLN